MNANLIQNEILRRDDSSRSPQTLSPTLTKADHDTLQILDEHYERALEDGYVSYCAREACIFRNALLSVVSLAAFISIGTAVFSHHPVAGTHIPIVDSVLFTMVTWTTTGYGTEHLKVNNAVMAFLIVYIYCGIATLTIFVTEVYQYLALVAARSRYDYKKEYLALIFRASDDPDAWSSLDNTRHGSITTRITMPLYLCFTNPTNKHWKRVIHFFQDNPVGQLYIALVPCILIILFSGAVFTWTEGWSYLEGIYFSTVSLTTVGYGDFTPTRLTTKWFCIFWLPLSIPFMGWFMSGIARFFLTLDERNIQRYEKTIRDKLRKMQLQRPPLRKNQSQEHFIVPNSPELEMTIQRQSLLLKKEHDLILTVENGHDNSSPSPSSSSLSTSQESMKTMKQVLDIVRLKLASSTAAILKERNTLYNSSPVAQYFSLRAAKQISAEEAGKPSFLLRTLVLERLANIIANDVAGSQSTTETNETSITVNLLKLKDIAMKWNIPSTAQKAFFSVCTQTLYFVGVHTLEIHRADALFELRSYDFHVLFGNFLANMGSSDDMENWLKATNILAKEIFIGPDVEELLRRKRKRDSIISSPLQLLKKSESESVIV